MNEEWKIEGTRKIFVAWVNSDLTEGKGYRIPLFICMSRTTAIRLGKGRNVLWSDAFIEEDKIFKIGGKWYGPCLIEHPSREDIEIDEISKRKEEIVAKAKKAGLTEDDLKIIAS